MAPTNMAAKAETVDAVGKATEALEYVERARGHLYAFHQLIGRADLLFEEAPAAWLAPGMLGRRRRCGGMSSPRRTPAPLDVPDRRGLRRRLLPSGPLGGLRARTASRRGSSPRARGGAATRRRVSPPRLSPQRRRKLADHRRSLPTRRPSGDTRPRRLHRATCRSQTVPPPPRSHSDLRCRLPTRCQASEP